METQSTLLIGKFVILVHHHSRATYASGSKFINNRQKTGKVVKFFFYSFFFFRLEGLLIQSVENNRACAHMHMEFFLHIASPQHILSVVNSKFCSIDAPLGDSLHRGIKRVEHRARGANSRKYKATDHAPTIPSPLLSQPLSE